MRGKQRDGGDADADDKEACKKHGYAIEIIIFVGSISLMMFTPASTQYVQSRVCEQLRTEATLHDAKFCDSDAVTGHSGHLLELYQIVSSVPSFFTVTMLGIVSDRYGRKPMLIFSLALNAAQGVMYLVVAQWNLSLDYLYIGYAVNGLSGGFSLLLMLAFASAADRCTKSERTWRVSVMEGCVIVGGCGGSLITGYILKYFGYRVCFATMSGIMLLCLVAVVVFVSEPLAVRHRRQSLSFEEANIWGVLQIIFKNRFLPILLFAFFINVTIYIGPISVSILFFKQEYHWTPERIGWYLSLKSLISGLGIMVCLPLASRLFAQQRDYTLAMFGEVCFCAFAICTALVDDSMLTFVVTVLGLSSLWATPVIRAFMSRHAEAHEQGAIFSAIAAVEAVTSLAGAFLFNDLYSKTAKSTPWLFWMMIPAGGFCVMVLLTIYRSIRPDPARDSYQPLPIQEPGVVF